MMSKMRNKKIIATLIAIVIVIGASSFAFFTDRTNSNIDGQAGSVCLELSDIKGNIHNLAPGDKRELAFSYKNLGSLSMDTRVTYRLSYKLNEYVEDRIKNDLDKIVTLSSGDKSVTLTKDDKFIDFVVEGAKLNGTKEKGGEDVVDANLDFYFHQEVGNIGQNMAFYMDVIVEGKQSRHNPSWEKLHKTTINFGPDSELKVVPESACNVAHKEYNVNYYYLDVDYYSDVPSGIVDDVKQLNDDEINEFVDVNNILIEIVKRDRNYDGYSFSNEYKVVKEVYRGEIDGHFNSFTMDEELVQKTINEARNLLNETNIPTMNEPEEGVIINITLGNNIDERYNTDYTIDEDKNTITHVPFEDVYLSTSIKVRNEEDLYYIENYLGSSCQNYHAFGHTIVEHCIPGNLNLYLTPPPLPSGPS